MAKGRKPIERNSFENRILLTTIRIKAVIAGKKIILIVVNKKRCLKEFRSIDFLPFADASLNTPVASAIETFHCFDKCTRIAMAGLQV